MFVSNGPCFPSAVSAAAVFEASVVSRQKWRRVVAEPRPLTARRRQARGRSRPLSPALLEAARAPAPLLACTGAFVDGRRWRGELRLRPLQHRRGVGAKQTPESPPAWSPLDTERWGGGSVGETNDGAET
ncbi:uncharacterized protein Tco025E_01717 [Trypanosoma conorhini]|uniref:Uncharacterized protein n=1 Tax=Trypanosoma conorhini TaxID=83891 RepID=A0A3R7PJ57_9TRYP|nr:uncharacterized protein Tco025E_01717 [Trypanosoma conorhini]RNF26088.1 hypothetical protein Tco025E_01717 [Trypanosoma conorhini]